MYHLNPLSIKSLIQKSKRYIFMGRFLPVKFFPSSLLNLLSPSPHFPLWKDKSLLLPTVLSSRSFSTLLSLSSALCVYLTLPGFAGASPLALSSPAPPTPPRLRPAGSACWASELVLALLPVQLCALEY